MESENLYPNVDKRLKDDVRKVVNIQIDIFQSPGEYAVRNPELYRPYYNSFEHRQSQKEAIKILNSSSNLAMYAYAKGMSIKEARDSLRMSLYVSKSEDFYNNLVAQQEKFQSDIIFEVVKNDPEYIYLKDLVNHPRFDTLMKNNREFLSLILNHKYFKYLENYKKIDEKYRQYLYSVVNIEQDEEDMDND